MRSQGSSPNLVPEGTGRRRDKRRHNNSSGNHNHGQPSAAVLAIVNKPLALLELAVEIDSRKMEFLQEPLEMGRVFNPKEEEFYDIVQKLSEPIRETPTKAWTPIVLSGLLQQQQQQQQKQSESANASSTDTNLVNHANVLRSQALLRLKRRKELHRFRIIGVVLMVIVVIIATLQQGLRDLGSTIEHLGYLGKPGSLRPCTSYSMEEARDLCHELDARVWSAIRDYPIIGRRVPCQEGHCPPSSKNLILQNLNQIPGRQHSVDPDVDHHAPYSMHTVVTQGVRRKPRRGSSSTMGESNNQQRESIRWLGDSRLMQLIRPHVGKKHRILDIGCGISSLLYSLSPRPRNYTGISTSPAAIQVSQYLAKHHGLNNLHSRLELKQMRLSHYLQWHQQFDVIVAVESLSQQTNMGMDLIIQKLTHQLKPQGKLIIVDDVVAQPHLKNEDLNRQLLSHANWTSMFHRNSLYMETQRDLGLEFTLPQLEKSSSHVPFHQNNNNHQALATLLQWLEPFVESYPQTKRMLRLFQDTLRVNQKEERRALAHQEGKLMYALYVGTKVVPNAEEERRRQSMQHQQCNAQQRQQQCQQPPQEQCY